jgi:putative hydrolases of HD superfamily
MTPSFHDLMKLRKIYRLKNVERFAFVGKRHESPAEHTWSMLMLADFLLPYVKKHLNREHVFELILYHDVVEIETGDVPIQHEKKREHRQALEKTAVKKLRGQLPITVGRRLHKLFYEFEERKTTEAKFAYAMDRFDAFLHELDYPDDWIDWNESMVHKYNDDGCMLFPELIPLYEKILAYVRKGGYYRSLRTKKRN